MRLLLLKSLIFFLRIFLMSCSVELLNLQNDLNNLHLNVVNEDIYFDYDSLKLV